MGTLIVAGNDLTPALLNQYYGFADTTTTTVTAASQTALTTSYSIPANEAAVGSAYEVRFGGSGTWGSTQQLISFTFVVGSTVTLSNISIGAQAFAASAQFRFSGLVSFVWNAIGASGTFLPSYMINMTQIANAVQVPATVNQANLEAANSIGLADAGGAVSGATDTTGALAVVVKCGWAGTTGAPTITNRQTIFRKVA